MLREGGVGLDVRECLCGGDLKAVEEEAGTFGVDLVGGEALDDFAEGSQELDAVARGGEGEAAAGTVRGVGGAVAPGVVVEAVVFATEGGGATGVPVGKRWVQSWSGIYRVGASPQILLG